MRRYFSHLGAWLAFFRFRATRPATSRSWCICASVWVAAAAVFPPTRSPGSRVPDFRFADLPLAQPLSQRRIDDCRLKSCPCRCGSPNKDRSCNRQSVNRQSSNSSSCQEKNSPRQESDTSSRTMCRLYYCRRLSRKKCEPLPKGVEKLDFGHRKGGASALPQRCPWIDY